MGFFFLVKVLISYSFTCLLCLQDDKDESLWVEQLLRFHAARVRDVELLAALSFFHNTKYSVSELLQFKTFIPDYL